MGIERLLKLKLDEPLDLIIARKIVPTRNSVCAFVAGMLVIIGPLSYKSDQGNGFMTRNDAYQYCIEQRSTLEDLFESQGIQYLFPEVEEIIKCEGYRRESLKVSK